MLAALATLRLILHPFYTGSVAVEFAKKTCVGLSYCFFRLTNKRMQIKGGLCLAFQRKLKRCNDASFKNKFPGMLQVHCLSLSSVQCLTIRTSYLGPEYNLCWMAECRVACLSGVVFFCEALREKIGQAIFLHRNAKNVNKISQFWDSYANTRFYQYLCSRLGPLKAVVVHWHKSVKPSHFLRKCEGARLN